MSKFHPRAIWWCDVSKSRLGSLSLLRAPRQSDAYTCLRLVIGESEVGSRDVIPLAGTASFISRTQPGSSHIIHHSETDLHTLVYPTGSFSAHHHYCALVILYSYESYFL